MNRELAASLESLHLDAFGWAVHCCGGDHGRAEDVLQAAYLKIMQGTSEHGGRSTFKTWWFGLIRLTAYEEFRRLRYRESLLGKLLAALASGQEAHDTRASPSRQLELNEQALHLQALLAQLPARQAEVLHLVFYQDLSIVEAAAVMKVSPGSARQHYERGKAKLRTLLDPSLSSHCYE